MSIQAVAWALEQKVPAGPKLVLVALANHADHSTGLCWPSTVLISHEASCTPRAVYRFVADLARNGFVSVEKKRGKDGKQRSNNYWLLFDRLPLKWEPLPKPQTQDAGASDPEDQGVASSVVHEDEPGELGSPGDGMIEESPENAMTPGVNDSPNEHMSPGPSEHRVTRQSLPEPSSVEPSRPSALRAPTAPRGYDRKARPSAQASAAAEEARRRSAPVFVIAGTRAYKAWQAVKTRERNTRIIRDGKMQVVEWDTVTTAVIDGKNVRGWWFPSLFPPSGHDPPSTLTDEDTREVMKF